MASKRHASDSWPDGPRSVEATTQHTMDNMLDQLNMAVPQDAMADHITNTKHALDAHALNARVKKELSKRLPRALEIYANSYHHSVEKCECAVDSLSSKLLPAIFYDSQDVSFQDYEDTIIRNPWLVKVLFDAFKNGQSHDVRRIGLCGSYIARPPPLNLPVDLRCLPLAAPGKEEQTRRESRFH